jgi:hypothetical protein
MPVPTITVILTYVDHSGYSHDVYIEKLLSQETNAMLSALIEDPTGTNNFMAGDVSLKGYDVPNGTSVRSYFTEMTPLSTNFSIFIQLSIVPPGASVAVQDVTFQGYIAPNTVQFEPRTGAFSFTAIGYARLLQTTSAAGLFLRPGYFDGKWCLYSDVSPLDLGWTNIKIARVDGIGQSAPDFLRGDTIQLLNDEQGIIGTVIADPSTSPPAFWSLGITPSPTKVYPPGPTALVHLLTPYRRGVGLYELVSGLFTAAGFPTEQYFFSAPLPNLGAGVVFATPVSTVGLADGSFCSGIAAVVESGGIGIVVSQPSGAYQMVSPTSGFMLDSAAAGYRQPPVDATNYGTAVTMFGPKRSYTRVGNQRFGMNITMKCYGYDHLAGNKRYVLTVTCNADVAPGTAYAITTELGVETCTAGAWVWGGYLSLFGIGIATTTSTNLAALYFKDAIGIDVDPATGTVFFTDIQLVGAAGTPVTMNTSSYQPTGAGYAASRVAALNGPIVITAPGRCVVFQVDGILGKNPTSQTFTLVASGAMTLLWTQPVTPNVIGHSLKKNAGDGRYYMLLSDPTVGTVLLSSADDYLVPDSAHLPVQIDAKGYEADLAVQYGVSNGAGVACPMFALIGGAPVFISNTGSGYFPYADLSGLSVGDVLQQLSVVAAGFFYIREVGQMWNFRSRSHPMPGDTIGTSDQIDGDPGFISLVVQPVYNRWVGYVSVENENNAAIFGDTSNVAGSIAYASANTQSGQQTYSLELKSRFVTTPSFAAALANSLYNYLGAQKRWIEINRFRDGRAYEVGRTFHCNVDGSNRQFQIIEVDQAVCGVTVKVVGLEV